MMIYGPRVTERVLIVECRDKLDLDAYWNLDFDGTPLMSGLAADGRTPRIADGDELTLLYARAAYPTLRAAQAEFDIQRAAQRERSRPRPRHRPVRGGVRRGD